MVRILRLLYGRDPEVSIVAGAIGELAGTLPLHLNLANPTISTSSETFIQRASEAPSFRGPLARADHRAGDDHRRADKRSRRTPVYQDRHRGARAGGAARLSQPVFALSIEFVPMALIGTEVALDRLMQLGDYAFNASYWNDMRLLHPAPLSANEIRGWLRSLGDDGPAGDLYAGLDANLLRRRSSSRSA